MGGIEAQTVIFDWLKVLIKETEDNLGRVLRYNKNLKKKGEMNENLKYI